jgi:hypothetical protein
LRILLLLGGIAKNRVVDCDPVLPGIDVGLKEEAMTSKIATITSFAAVLGIASVSAVASPPSKTDIPPPYAADIHVSSGAPSARDASQLVLLDKGPSQLVDAFFAYAESLNDVHDLSLERLQFALGRKLPQRNVEGGGLFVAYPEGDWIEISFSDGGRATGRSATLHFGNEKDPNGPLPSCRLSFDGLRDRFRRAGYAESQDLGELGDVVVWLFSKTSDVWIEVATRWARPNDDLMCAWTIRARGQI